MGRRGVPRLWGTLRAARTARLRRSAAACGTDAQGAVHNRMRVRGRSAVQGLAGGTHRQVAPLGQPHERLRHARQRAGARAGVPRLLPEVERDAVHHHQPNLLEQEVAARRAEEQSRRSIAPPPRGGAAGAAPAAAAAAVGNGGAHVTDKERALCFSALLRRRTSGC